LFRMTIELRHYQVGRKDFFEKSVGSRKRLLSRLQDLASELQPFGLANSFKLTSPEEAEN
jgi:hypothetical protein